MIRMDGKICMVTGGNSGTGYVTALELARAGALVVILCRNAAKGEAARAAIVRATGNPAVELLVADLAEMPSVEAAAAAFRARHDRLDVLVNNAGGIVSPRRETSRGVEAMWAGNYLGHVLLTMLLLDRLRAAGPARIINVSSIAHNHAKIDFDSLRSAGSAASWTGYGQSKLAQILFTYELADRLAGSGVTVNAMHPGAVASGFKNGVPGVKRLIASAIYGLFGISPEKGADTILYLATSPDVAGVTGRYFIKRKAVPSRGASNDVALRKRLWDASEAMLRELGAHLPA